MPPAIDFQALFGRSPNLYMLLDRRMKYVAANAAYLRATASTLDDLLGRDVFEAFPNDPDNLSTRVIRQSFERVLATGEVDVVALIPYRVPSMRDGQPVVEPRLWSATHTPIQGADGQVAYILQHTVDVTGLHALLPPSPLEPVDQIEAGVLGRAREVQEKNLTLDAERRHLRSLFEQAPTFMCFLRGRDHIFEIANTPFYQVVGHRKIIGKPVREALPEFEAQGFIELLDRVFQTAEPFVASGIRAQFQRHPDAPRVDVLLDFSYQPILGTSGTVAGILVQGYDITTQKRQETEHDALLGAERAARSAAEAAERQQRFLAESIPQQVWTSLPNGNLDFVNQRALEYFGASEAEVVGAGWLGVVHPDDVPGAVQRWSHSLRTGDEYEVEFRLKRADGSYRWHLARALALRDADGRIVKWFGTNTDMDELKRARDELQKRAEFDQQLIGIVSHDLRNPLNAIGMATSLLLRRGQLDEQHVKIVSRIMSSSERAVRLIRDFLDFTHARVSGRIPIALEPSNIREIARHVFEEVHLMHPARPATVEHTGEESGTWDSDRLAQLIGNLLSNAFQHGSAQGAVKLMTRGDELGVVIEVHNDGAPISPDDAARLFEPFQRGMHASVHSGRSVGLGLYISKEIAVAHGGTISVQSTAQDGTRFSVRLPREPRPLTS